MMLRHTSGLVSLVDCTYASKQMPDPFPNTLIEIEGTIGALRLDADLKLTVSTQSGTTVTDADAPVLDWAERPWHVVQDSVRATCAHMLNRWKAGEAADVSAADNVKTYALCEAAYQSAEDGALVRPSPNG